MKISLNWLLEHLGCKKFSDLEISLDALMLKFNQKVAEIEGFKVVSFEKEDFFAVKISQVDQSCITANLTEKNQNINLSLRENVDLDQVFLVSPEQNGFTWTTLNKLGLKKDGLAPAVHIDDKKLAGGWKSEIDWVDVVLEIDNKTITNRPDMWGHRGFAREIGLLTGQTLRPNSELLATLPVMKSEDFSSNSTLEKAGLAIKNQAPGICKAFNAATFVNISNVACMPQMLFRLAKIDIKPINAIVDLTNYLMADWGQPVHAYDADNLPNGKIIVRTASQGEKLVLLDDQILELTPKDLIIANQNGPIGLAGIMGGKNDSISAKTKSIVLESANFAASDIRQSSQHHKLRTESSTRFEKTLDPEMALDAVQRFYRLAETFNISITLQGSTLSLCQQPKPTIISVEHEFFEQKIGVQLRENDITKPLQALEFKVEIDHSDEKPYYKILVPSFRATKDIKIAEDLVEEVARSYGFEKITPQLPKLAPKTHDLSVRQRLLNAKNFLAYGAQMIEQYNYIFFHQDFIAKLNFNPGITLNVQNPVNENTVRLVTTLIPGLLANIEKNYHLAEQLAFFEVGKTWHVAGPLEHSETSTLSGIFWQKRTSIDFFACKGQIEQLLTIFNVNIQELSWINTDQSITPWEHPHINVTLEYLGKKLGSVGKINHLVWSTLGFLPDCDGLYFELNLDLLKALPKELVKAQPLPKTQWQFFDLAFIAGDGSSAQEFTNKIFKADPQIKQVLLMDEFRKPEWTNKRSLTFRIKLQSATDKPISREQVEQITLQAKEILVAMGTEIRD